LTDFFSEIYIFLKFNALSHIGNLGNGQRFLIFYCLPIDALKERMRLDLACALCSQSMHEIFVEKLTDEIFSLGRDHSLFVAHLRPLDFEISDIVDDFFYSFCTKRTGSNHQLVSHYTQAPPINRKIAKRGLEDYLRSDVVRSSDEFHLLLVVAQHSLPSSTSLSDVLPL